MRDLEWQGCCNVRDLGGLPLTDGGCTRWRAVVRADSVQKLTAAGWEALVDHGIRTVIDLRNDDEVGADTASRPAELTTVRLPLDGLEHREYWDQWQDTPAFGTPLYYRPHIESLPARSAAVLSAIAHAQPGGVLIHCVGGRDRTGQIVILLLALLGVLPEEIIADYERSDTRLKVQWAAEGMPDPAPIIAEFLAERATSAPALIAALLTEVDLFTTLARGGLTAADLGVLRTRLV